MRFQSNKSPDLVDMSCADSGFLDDGFTMKDYYKPEETFTLPRRAGVEEYKQMPTDEELDSGRYKRQYAPSADIHYMKSRGWVEHTGEKYGHIPCPSGGFMVFMFKPR